jgi:hypothetical protein
VYTCISGSRKFKLSQLETELLFDKHWQVSTYARRKISILATAPQSHRSLER